AACRDPWCTPGTPRVSTSSFFLGVTLHQPGHRVPHRHPTFDHSGETLQDGGAHPQGAGLRHQGLRRARPFRLPPRRRLALAELESELVIVAVLARRAHDAVPESRA